MLLSPRTAPRLSLRRAASYNANDRGPLSSTSSRFSFNYLIATPPPSPGLPALIPRHGKTIPTTPRKYVRGLVWLMGVLVIVYYGVTRTQSGPHGIAKVGWENLAGQQFEMVEDEELPDFPTPVVITDKRGWAKWTVSIPPNSEFPLEPRVMADICMQNMEVASHVADLHSHSQKVHVTQQDYYHVDPYFMDVAEAEVHGLLPGPKARTSMKEDGLVGEKQDSLIEGHVCAKSMTFLMATANAGLGETLMLLWMAYGLAQKEGRAFFVDDSRWAYGQYTSYFLPPPSPNCRSPPRHEMLPCPHHARHLVVSAATVRSTFGGAFNDHFEDPRRMEVARQKPIFDMARAGYEALFHLVPADAKYVTHRLESMQKKTAMPNGNGIVVGIHVRHGDRHPYEFQYKDSYIPLTTYADQARDILHAAFNGLGSGGGGENLIAEMHSLMVVASDDPDVYESDEFSHAWKAQNFVHLAAAYTAPPNNENEPAQAIRKFVDESVGWEGGFFAGMFWSLGRPSSVPATAVDVSENTQLQATDESLRLRELVGRAYLLDLAVLGKSDRLICTVSSMGCKVLGVMAGWQKVIGGDWVNVDGDFEWRGVSW